MKITPQKWFLPMILEFTLILCSSNSDDSLPQFITEFDYSQDGLKLTQVINEYREIQGLNPLEVNNRISYKSKEQNLYMIENNMNFHADFDQQTNNIIHLFDAVKDDKILAYIFPLTSASLCVWLQSP